MVQIILDRTKNYFSQINFAFRLNKVLIHSKMILGTSPKQILVNKGTGQFWLSSSLHNKIWAHLIKDSTILSWEEPTWISESLPPLWVSEGSRARVLLKICVGHNFKIAGSLLLEYFFFTRHHQGSAKFLVKKRIDDSISQWVWISSELFFLFSF